MSAAAQARSATAAALQNSPSPSPAPIREKRRREGHGRREEEGEKDGKKVSQTILVDSIRCLSMMFIAEACRRTKQNQRYTIYCIHTEETPFIFP